MASHLCQQNIWPEPVVSTIPAAPDPSLIPRCQRLKLSDMNAATNTWMSVPLWLWCGQNSPETPDIHGGEPCSSSGHQAFDVSLPTVMALSKLSALRTGAAETQRISSGDTTGRVPRRLIVQGRTGLQGFQLTGGAGTQSHLKMTLRLQSKTIFECILTAYLKCPLRFQRQRRKKHTVRSLCRHKRSRPSSCCRFLVFSDIYNRDWMLWLFLK